MIGTDTLSKTKTFEMPQTPFFLDEIENPWPVEWVLNYLKKRESLFEDPKILDTIREELLLSFWYEGGSFLYRDGIDGRREILAGGDHDVVANFCDDLMIDFKPSPVIAVPESFAHVVFRLISPEESAKAWPVEESETTAKMEV